MFFVDVQGTLICDDKKMPIDGAVEFIERLNKTDIPYMIITNNTKKSSVEFYEYLQNIGFDFAMQRYLDPLMLLESKLSKDDLIAAYGSKEFLTTLQSMGYTLDYNSPSVVLVAIKDDFQADEYAQMIEFLLNGSALIGMHETTLYAKNSKRYPGVGAILKMLEFATGVKYDVVGKPSKTFYKEALKRLQQQRQNASYNDVTIISDDVKGDLIGAKKLGMKTIFVTSGKYRDANEILPSIDDELQPQFVYKNMQEVLSKYMESR